ncbi:MAG: phosphate ABC transporter substrate-binding protein [Gammaproteobacteria bacterium]
MYACLAMAEPETTLNWVGCGISKKAYVTDLAKAFEKKTDIRINIQGGGATKGIREVVTGTADLGGSCRYQLPEDPREAGAGLEPVAWDALVVITNKGNPVDNLSMEQVKEIYTGKIRNWQVLGGPNAPVEVYTRKGKHSGVGRTLRKLIFADFDQKIVSTKSFPSSGPLEKAIMDNPHAIGITGISSARLRDVKILKLENIYPTYDAVKGGEYQLYRPLYLTYNPKSEKLAEVKQFISFCHSHEGREIMRKNGTLPYREGVHLVMRQIEQDLSAFRKGADFSDMMGE